ncbi:MAG: HAD family hydrolase [Candidatus Adiutrix sp.]|jgi:phosphoglycolate phosphatase|nr:HAD family hydrolase [Candidatus Adiutrix sp.]
MSQDFNAVVFDLDGTLLDTLGDIADSINEVLGAEGLPLRTREEVRLMIGHGLEMALTRALPEDRRSPAQARPLARRVIDIYHGRQTETTKAFPGIADLLDDLKGRGLGLAVLSNKPHPNTLEMVEYFFPGIFQIVLGLRPEVPAKPDPAAARETAAFLGLSPSRILYLGDSEVDMKTAAAAGMFPVGADWGYRTRAELAAAGARKIIASPSELTDFFR